ncbi:MAG: Ig-like domain-containing protein, partial [Pseudomonadota bacterium]
CTNVIGGGAIFVGAGQSLAIENSSFVGNDTFNAPLAQPQEDAAGGAILIRSGQTLTSTVDIFQSTFSDNSATGVGGAIALGGPGFPAEISELSLRHATLVLNESDSNDDEIAVAGGGGVWSASSEPVQLFNSVVAENIDNANSPAADLHGSMNSFGFNLIGDNATVSGTFPPGLPNANDDWVGSTASPIDPMLEALANSGGPTPVHVPMLASPLVDQGRCGSRLTDQRLFQNAQTGLRIIDIGNIADAFDGCDIGAVELFSTPSDPVPVANDDNYTALEDQPLVVSAANGLLQNDVDDDSLVVIEVSPADQSRGFIQAQVNATADGAFVFETLLEDQSGTAEFTYVITDNISTASGSLLIEVLPVNDPPSFQAATTQVSATPGAPSLVEDWASELGAGPADEQGQSLQLFVSAVNVPMGFFTIPPSLSINGGTADLSFELAPDAEGSAVVSVVLQDGGGTANGGINQSDEVLLTIDALGDQIFSSRFEEQ